MGSELSDIFGINIDLSNVFNQATHQSLDALKSATTAAVGQATLTSPDVQRALTQQAQQKAAVGLAEQILKYKKQLLIGGVAIAGLGLYILLKRK